MVRPRTLVRRSRASARRLRKRRRRALTAILGAVILVGAYVVMSSGGEPPESPATARELPTTNAPVRRGCSLSKEILVRMWRGYDPTASDDVMMVPFEPNFWGYFTYASHTGPWDYLQTVPLVFYGPGRIQAQGKPLEADANITDVYPTVERLLHLQFPERPGNRVLKRALQDGSEGVPRLIFVVMWDGVGRNVLERWPQRWPTLARLEREGTSFLGATVGSSPSNTPPTHSSLGTGTWPRNHGVVAIDYRSPNGDVMRPFVNGDPSALELSTFADEVDQRYGNASKVGMVAWQIQEGVAIQPSAQSWHQGMLGHGASMSGGDQDQIALLGHDGIATGNEDFFEVPAYVTDTPLLEEEAHIQDLADGKADGNWLGNDLLTTHNNPAWIRYQTQVLLRMLEREGYGSDQVPDMFFTNFKVTDIVGHQHMIDAEEMGFAVKAQDQALGQIVDYLDDNVGDYVLVLSADHGHTPDPKNSGAWPIVPREVVADLNSHFHVPDGDSVVESTSASGLFLQRDVAEKMGVGPQDVAEFLNGYTIADNWPEEGLPEGYEARAGERVFSAAFAREQFPDVIECAFGRDRPPRDLEG